MRRTIKKQVKNNPFIIMLTLIGLIMTGFNYTNIIHRLSFLPEIITSTTTFIENGLIQGLLTINKYAGKLGLIMWATFAVVIIMYRKSIKIDIHNQKNTAKKIYRGKNPIIFIKRAIYVSEATGFMDFCFIVGKIKIFLFIETTTLFILSCFINPTILIAIVLIAVTIFSIIDKIKDKKKDVEKFKKFLHKFILIKSTKHRFVLLWKEYYAAPVIRRRVAYHLKLC